MTYRSPVRIQRHGVLAEYRVDPIAPDAVRVGDACLIDPAAWGRDFPTQPPSERAIVAMLDREARAAEHDAVAAWAGCEDAEPYRRWHAAAQEVT